MARGNPIISAIAQGKREGRWEVKKQVLDYLETKFMDNSVEQDSQVGKMLLEIAGELSELLP